MMKRTFINLFNHAFLHTAGLYLLGATAILTSCEKDKTATDGMELPETNTQYVLHPPIVNIEAFGGGSPVTRAALAMEERQAFNVGEELGNIITLGNSEMEDIPQTRAFANGTYYRIVIYKLSEWNAGTLKIYAQRLCKTGSADYFADMGDSTKPVYLKKGDYRIFCYSFNKTTTEKMEKLADGTANVPLADGDDFLSSDIISKSIDASHFDTSVALGTITLKHRCCQLIGTLTAEDFTGIGIAASPAPSLSVTSAFTTAGNWSIKNTNFSVTTSSNSTKTFTLAKSNNNYTDTFLLLPLANKPLAANYTFKPNGAIKNAAASNKSVSGSATFASGGSYSFTIKAIGAYVVSETNPVQIGNYKWAYSNLDGQTKKLESKPWISGPLDGNSISAVKGTTTITSSLNDWWHWNVLNVDVSTSYGPTESTWNINNDPCRAGLGSAWKVPPKKNFDDLVQYILKSKKVYINGETMTTNAYGWTKGTKTVGCVFVDKSKGTCIFLPAAGNRSGIEWGGVVSFGYYLSATQATSDTYGGNFLYFDSSSCYVYNRGNRIYALSLRCAQ